MRKYLGVAGWWGYMLITAAVLISAWKGSLDPIVIVVVAVVFCLPGIPKLLALFKAGAASVQRVVTKDSCKVDPDEQ